MNDTAAVVCKRITRARSMREIRRVFELFLMEPEEQPAKLGIVTDENGKYRAVGSEMAVVHSEGEDRGHYELREAADLAPSHDAASGFKKHAAYPEGVQERPYHSDNGEQEKVKRNAMRLDPRFLITDNPDAVNGPPVVTEQGVVLGGNSRAMSIISAYADFPESAGRYRQALKDKAPLFGMTSAEVEAFKAPILVRVTEGIFSNDDMARRARLYNQAFTQGLQIKAEGVSKGRLVSENSLSTLAAALGDSFDSIREYLESPRSQSLVESLIADGVIEQTQIAKLTKKGSLLLNEDGKRLVEHVMRGKAIDDFDLLDQLAPAMAAKLDRLLASLSQIKAKGGEWDITGKLKEALRQAVKFSFSGIETPEAFWKVQSLFPEENSIKEDPQVRALFFLMVKGKPKEIEAVWKLYAGVASRDSKGQVSLPGVPIPTPESAFRKAFAEYGVLESALAADWPPFMIHSHADACRAALEAATALEAFAACFAVSENAEQILEAAAQVRTPASTEENIRRGTEAMKHVISSKRKEPHAMYRKEIGWIAFDWGKPGESPPEFKSDKERSAWWQSLKNKFSLFKGGYGVSHIIAKRDWEGKWIVPLLGQKGKDFAFKLVDVTAKGKISRHGRKCIITSGKLEVILVPDGNWADSVSAREQGKKKEEYWVISGFEILADNSQYKTVFESSGDMDGGYHPFHATHNMTTACPSYVGADDSKFLPAGEPVGEEPTCPTHPFPSHESGDKAGAPFGGEQATTSILSEPTHLLPTGYRQEVGAADPLVQNIHHHFPNDNISQENRMDTILERALPDVEKKVRAATTFQQIKSLFKELFVIPATAPDSYKNETGEYGLKVRGKKAREVLNEQCRAILARASSPEDLTPEDAAVLRQYSGRGGLTENSQFEYYTPAHVAEGVWDALKANGFENGNVLDPCCGAGVFSGTKPEGVIVSGNDLDPIGSKITALLNPGDAISTQPFERLAVNTPDDTFDSCVGNVPFGNARGASMHEDPAYKGEKLIERYFLLRILDKVKPGRLACLICPTNIVGNKGRKWEEFRMAISRKAEFLGAHKLPSKTFAAQGTDTVVDIVVLRKHSRELLERLDEISLEALKAGNVFWDEFIKGKYWQGEGRKFIMGKYVPKVDGERWSREVVDGDIDNATLKRNLARKFHSRIDWEAINLAEPVIRAYTEGDRRSVSGTMYELRHGAWQKVVDVAAETAIDRAKYGAESVEELRSRLSSLSGGLSFSLDMAFAAYKSFPDMLSEQQKDAVVLAISQPKDEYREQIYRGSILGAMIARMGAAADAGEDVAHERLALQEMITAEIEKYGHPSNNSGLCLMGGHSRAFGLFKNAVDADGNFSDLLSGRLNKGQGKGYNAESVGDVVNHLFVHAGQTDITLEDVKELYKGQAEIKDLGDIAGIDEIAITPEGLIMPRGRYCAGDVMTKMAACAEAIALTDDDRLKSKFRQQIDVMKAKMTTTKPEDIAFGLRDKWFSKKYIVDFLRENGFHRADYGATKSVERTQYDGSVETVEQFVADYDSPDGSFVGIPDVKFDGQFLKYLEGKKITSNKEETIREYRDKAAEYERMFNIWMQQHQDIDELAESYNRKFNSFVPYEYEGDPLGIDDLISGEIIPHSYQNAEVRRLSDQGAGICGFGVGLGKSFTALATAAYNYKKGRAKRTCIVVPAAVLENWYHESRTFYSEAYMRSNVLFVGLEPKTDKDGNVERKPVLDENGQPRTGKGGTPVLQDQIQFLTSAEDTFKTMWKIPQSNYSLVVMTKEKFASIPLRPSTREAYTEEMVARQLMSEKKADSVNKKSYQDDKHLLNTQAKYSNEGTKKKDELPYLEDMGFDSVITDESHFFKNSLEPGRESQGIAYLPTAPSANIAVDMAIKCHYLRQRNGGRGVYGLTATPVTNSPFEIFNMLSLVAPPDEFERFGVRTVDDFVNVFGEIKPVSKMKVDGSVAEVMGLVGFKNLDGLRNLFHKYVNVKTVKDVDDEIHVPNAEEHEEHVPISAEQDELYQSLRTRAKLIAQGQIKESIFSVIRDMDRLTTDIDMFRHTMTFVFPRNFRAEVGVLAGSLPTTVKVDTLDEDGRSTSVTLEVSPKIMDDGGDTFSLVVHELLEDSVLAGMRMHKIPESSVAHPITPKYARMLENLRKHFEAGGKQIIFTEEKSQHHKIKRIIVHHLPITEDQIGIINADDAGGEKLDKISKAYNAGSIKVVIANKKAEVGVNLQKGTVAIHHLTLPWTPASINQRNGRGVRQGNKVDTVEVYYYCGKGTFDSYRKDLLQAKSNWIDNLLMGKEAKAENGDVTGFEEMLDMLADNPEEAKRARAERLAAEEEKRREAARSNLVNRFQVMVSVQAGLDSLEQRKEIRRNKLANDIDSAQRRLARLEAGGESESEEGRRRLESARSQLANFKAGLSGLDAAFENERSKLEARKQQASGMLRLAEKEGRLPFDARLIDNPGNSVVSTGGVIYSIGEYLELENGDICRIESLNQEDRSLRISYVLGRGYVSTLQTAKLKAKKVSYSESEIALKKMLADGIEYNKLLTCGLTKELFMEHKDSIRVSYHSGGITWDDGKVRIVSGWNTEGMPPIWPEPQNEDFRKAVLSEYLQMTRSGTEGRSAGLLAELFGPDFKKEALRYGRAATATEINEIIAEVWERFRSSSGNEASADRLLASINSLAFGGNVRSAFREKFDNIEDLTAALGIFREGMTITLKKQLEDEEREAARQKEEELKSHPGYKEIPEGMTKKFAAIGMTIRLNASDIVLSYRGRGKSFGAFSRYFIHDPAGLKGVLRRISPTLKARFGAEFTTDWVEHRGMAWWHVPATVDLAELYDLLS